MKNKLRRAFGGRASRLAAKKSTFTLAEGATHVALSDKSRVVAFTLAEGATHVGHCDKYRRVAFTLAEVLITLGIIGVVAAMTLPTLIQNHQKQTYVAGAKKATATVSNMLQKMMADEGVSSIVETELYQSTSCIFNGNIEDLNSWNNSGYYCSEDGYGNQDTFSRLVPKYMKVIKECNEASCEQTYKSMWKFSCDRNGKCSLASDNYSEAPFGTGYQHNGAKIFYTADGMIYYFAGGANGLSVAFDVNGTKGPNEYGRDLFCMTFIREKLIGSDCHQYAGYFGRTSPLGYLMSNGWKMDY